MAALQATGAAPTLVHASSVTRALNIVGDRSALLLLYCLFLGIRRFGEIQQNTGLSRSLLAGRLRRLEAQGLLRREPYQQRPPRHDYHLTAMGRDLYDVALAIIHWDKTWHHDPACLTHRLVHADCGRVFTPQPQCSACRAAIDARDVRWQPGPGSGQDPHPGASDARRSGLPAETLAGRHAIMVRSLETLGDRWTSQVIAAAFYRVRHFGDFQAGLGIAPNILSDRLARLLERGIFRRGPRGAYRLTEQGLDLFPIIVCLLRWGDAWLDGGRGAPLLLTHQPCGQPLQPLMACDACGEALHFGSFRLP